MVKNTLVYQNDEIEIHAIDDAVRPARTAPEMFPNASQNTINPHRAWLVQHELMEAESERLILAYRSWLIRLPELTLLFDLSIGEDKRHPLRPDLNRVKTNWFNDLGRAGIAPSEIDLVVVSHLHLDHVGWLTRLHQGKWQPTFPKARHLTTQKELNFWMEHHRDYPWMGESFSDSIEPAINANLFDFVEPTHEITKGVRLFSLPGHTPGMMGLSIERGGTHCLFVGDMIHHPLQWREPHLSTIFCHDGELAAKTRVDFMKQYADTGALVFPIHFSKPFGRIISTPNKDVFDFEFGA